MPDDNEHRTFYTIPNPPILQNGWYKHWRDAAAWVYLLIVLFDFMGAPIGLGFLSYFSHVAYIAWEPLTLRGGGFFHITFMMILGISAWTKGNADIESVKNQPDLSDIHKG